MKKLLFLLLFGLFSMLVMPANGAPPDSKFVKVEMVQAHATLQVVTLNVVLPQMDVYMFEFRSCLELTSQNKSQSGTVISNNCNQLESESPPMFYDLKIKRTGPLFDNTFRKVAGTVRICRLNGEAYNYRKSEIVQYSEIRIRGHDLGLKA
jgi:hypothetical protein